MKEYNSQQHCPRRLTHYEIPAPVNVFWQAWKDSVARFSSSKPASLDRTLGLSRAHDRVGCL